MGLAHDWNRTDVTRVARLGPDTNTATPQCYQHLISQSHLDGSMLKFDPPNSDSQRQG